MSKPIFYGMILIAAIGALTFLAKYSISKKAVPSLSDYLASTTATQTEQTSEFTFLIKTPNGNLRTVVASTSDTLAKGLSGRTSIPDDAGMLFSFPTPGAHGFWMKDMLFNIDMIWISADKRVIGVTSDVRTDSYPTVFYPPALISHVLEVNTGKAKSYGIATGTILLF